MQGVLYEVAVETGDSKSLLLRTHLLYLACIVVLIRNVTMVIVNPSLPASVKVDVVSSILQAAIRSCRCGLRSTAPIGVQLRVLPDQRSGFLALAAS
jgi:hypothetical protein